jgi:protoporphyrinogen oxidase
MAKVAIIIGAGPSGLTASLEMLRRTDIKPVIVEMSSEIGGTARTIEYHGNRMHIGSHPLFSNSGRVMQWWLDLVPASSIQQHTGTARQNTNSTPHVSERGIAPASHISSVASESLVHAEIQKDGFMLARAGMSRSYLFRRFFDNPATLSWTTLRKLGPRRSLRVGISYLASRMTRITPEKSLEDFLINRYGREFYRIFFKSFTEKLWGVPCHEISVEWGAQIHSINRTPSQRSSLNAADSRSVATDFAAKHAAENSESAHFLYPSLGAGQLWDRVSEEIVSLGGEIDTGCKVVGLQCRNNTVVSVEIVKQDGSAEIIHGDYFLSTMPVQQLIDAMETRVPANIRDISDGLLHRDTISIGLLVDQLRLQHFDGSALPDTSIDVRDSDVLLGRVQIFNNWSPGMVCDPATRWIGLEYFCQEGDGLWEMSDAELKTFAIGEAAKIGLIEVGAVLDAHIVRAAKAYPASCGTYDRLAELHGWVDDFENLYLIGRNSVHKHCNLDRSMLAAMALVDGLQEGGVDKTLLRKINTGQVDPQTQHHQINASSTRNAQPSEAEHPAA